MLVEARRYRLALRAYLRNGGSVSKVTQTTISSRASVQSLIDGRLAFVTQGKARKIESIFSERVQEWLRESASHDVVVGQVPTALVAPLVCDAFARYGRTATAQLLGTPERQLFAVLMERKGIRFEAADRIVAVLAGPTWWIENAERAMWYWSDERVFGKSSSQRAATNRKAHARWRKKALVAA